MEFRNIIPKSLSALLSIDITDFNSMIVYYSSCFTTEDEVYDYHGDHLGSANWITDNSGRPVQHMQYLPFGQPLVNQRAAGSTYSERFTFTGKERDEETGYGYFGARYMDHELMTMWLSVDPMADKYPSISPYAYCAWNPITIIDPDGRDGVPAINKREKSITVQVDIVFYMPNPGHIGRKTIDNWTKHLVSDINKEWNSRNWTYKYQGEKYSVKFDFSYWFDNKVHTDEDFKFDKNNNKKNYIELLGHSAYQYDKNSGKSIYKHRSKVRGGNTGLWYYDTKAAAHEAGHLLGLPDRYHEDSQAASGYSADPGWQGTIMAEPGGIGRVTQKDINDVLDRMLKTDKQ